MRLTKYSSTFPINRPMNQVMPSFRPRLSSSRPSPTFSSRIKIRIEQREAHLLSLSKPAIRKILLKSIPTLILATISMLSAPVVISQLAFTPISFSMWTFLVATGLFLILKTQIFLLLDCLYKINAAADYSKAWDALHERFFHFSQFKHKYRELYKKTLDTFNSYPIDWAKNQNEFKDIYNILTVARELKALRKKIEALPEMGKFKKMH